MVVNLKLETVNDKAPMKTNIRDFFPTRSLGRDLLFGLIPLIVIVATVVGTVNYWINTRRGINILNEQAIEATENLARILAYSIYNSKHSETAMIGQESKQLMNVVTLIIVDEIHNTVYKYEDDIPLRYMTVKKPITLFQKQLGYVEVGFSMNHIINQQNEFLRYTLIITVFTILTVGIASIILLEIMFRKPILSFIDNVKAIAAGSYEQMLSPMKHRYLNLIGQNINTMAEKISAREQHLKTIVHELEEQISEREKVETALRETKERFEELANMLPETIFETDERGFLTYLNRSGFERFGYHSGDANNGLKFVDLFSSPDEKRMEQDFKSAMEGKAVGSTECLAKHESAEIFQVLVHFNPIIHDSKAEGIRGILVDITESKRIEMELLSYQTKLRSLTKELLLTEERERRRIASELHDRIGHALTNVSIKINMLKEAKTITDKNIILNDINKLIAQSVQDVQSLIFEISPPILYDIGLSAAIDWLAEQMSKEYGLEITFKSDDVLKPMDTNIRALVFRAVHELLFNVVKHANAKSVKVSVIRQERELKISVEDDGIGLPVGGLNEKPDSSGFGLFSIRERLSHLDGHLTILSGSKQGTLVEINIPDA